MTNIFVYELSTGNVYQLTHDYYDYRMWWSPNNTQILFRDYSSNRDDGQNGLDLLLLNLDESYFPEYDQGSYAAAISTLTGWGMILFSLLLTGTAIVIMRRKQEI